MTTRPATASITGRPGVDVLELLFQSSADCIKLLDPQGRLLLMNAGGATAMELDHPGQLVGRDWVGFWSEEERGAARAAVTAAAQGRVGSCEGYLATAKGTPKWWNSVVSPVRAPDGRVAQLLVVSRDVTAQRETARTLEWSLRRTQAIILATSEIVWHADAAQRTSTFVGHAGRIGNAVDRVERGGWLDQIHPEDRARVDAASRRAIPSGTRYGTRYRLRDTRGEYRWVEDRAVPVKDDVGAVIEWVGVIADIHDRVLAERTLRESEERLRLALTASRVGIWDVDLVTGARRWSPDLKAIFGLPAGAQESEPLLLSLAHPDDRAAIVEAHRTAFRDTPSITFRIRRADTGEERWVISTGQAVLDAAGTPVRRLGTMQDITDRKTAEHQLWKAANQDALTGIPNRKLFQANLERAVETAAATDTRVALLILDIDHFKEVNDTLGHDAGDVVLRAIAARLAAAARDDVTIARLGGDEFAALIPDAGAPADVEAAAADLVRALHDPIPYGDQDLTCTASLGLAIYPDHDDAPGELLKNADVALYAAKRSGRARHAVFDPSMKSAMHRRVAVLQSARDALSRQHLVPFYQPKVSLVGAEVAGFEALLRWSDGSGLHGPDALAEAFDDPEIAAQIGQRMLDRVVADLVRWREGGLVVGSVALNVTAAEFASVDVAGRWLSKLDEAGLPAGALQMEVTEQVFLGEGATGVAAALDVLHRHGVSIALDDFGTGFASLTHLRQFPVDWLKIDQSFIRDLEQDTGAQTIVAAVVGLAHGIGLRVIAEGVENASQVALLTRQGCDLAQGFLVARPMVASRVPHFLTSWAGLAVEHGPEPRRRRA